MNPEIALAEIQHSLNLLNNKFQVLSNENQKISPLEVQEFIVLLRNLYEKSLAMQYAHSMRCLEETEAAIVAQYASQNESHETRQASSGSKIPTGPVHQHELDGEEKANIIPQDFTGFQNPVKHPTMDELLALAATKAAELNQQQETVRRKKVVADIHDTFTELPTVATRFSDKETLAKKMAGNRTQTAVAEKHRHKPITDLKSAIGINEKFLFINHLFGGNAQLYHSSIEMLNTCASHADALRFLEQNVFTIYEWDSKESPATMFMELIERRYLS
jgi:hypothetical protein